MLIDNQFFYEALNEIFPRDPAFLGIHSQRGIYRRRRKATHKHQASSCRSGALQRLPKKALRLPLQVKIGVGAIEKALVELVPQPLVLQTANEIRLEDNRILAVAGRAGIGIRRRHHQR